MVFGGVGGRQIPNHDCLVGMIILARKKRTLLSNSINPTRFGGFFLAYTVLPH